MTTMQPLLSQRALSPRSSSHLPAYLAVELPHDEVAVELQEEESLPSRLAALTPRLMRWSDEATHQVWILDLSLCEGYWQARAAAAGQEALTLVRTVLQEVLSHAGISSPLRVAMADHPWQVVLLVSQMRERELTGLVSRAGPFGEALFRDLSWETWWQCADTLVEHFQTKDSQGAQGRKRFVPAQFRRQSAQMQRAVTRLGCKGPAQLKDITSPALQRRFGAVLRDLAQWAYGPAEPFESGFPWQSFVFKSLPRVMRHFETPVCEWSHMEALLREDFDRLAGLACWQAGERVVSLELQLVLVNLAHLVIPIRFRHPHPLHLEKGCHATALLQALYSFESSPLGARQQNASAASNAEEELYKAVIGWTLVITERLILPPRSTGLFGDQAAYFGAGPGGSAGERLQDPDLLSLLALENKLRLPLESYASRADWLPEDSYERTGACGTATASFTDACAGQQSALMCVAAARPLYLYAKPQSFESQGGSSVWQFQERTMNKWWHSASGATRKENPLQRDYYRLVDRDQKDLWVFKTSHSPNNGHGQHSHHGQWHVHGVYA